MSKIPSILPYSLMIFPCYYYKLLLHETSIFIEYSVCFVCKLSNTALDDNQIRRFIERYSFSISFSKFPDILEKLRNLLYRRPFQVCSSRCPFVLLSKYKHFQSRNPVLEQLLYVPHHRYRMLHRYYHLQYCMLRVHLQLNGLSCEPENSRHFQ